MNRPLPAVSTMQELTDLLHTLQCSCIIKNGSNIRTFTERGIADLYRLLCEEPAFLKGAMVADKVVGKAAAAIMVAGAVGEIHADVISRAAYDLLSQEGTPFGYTRLVPYIVRHDGQGMCPMEELTLDAPTPLEAVARITKKQQPKTDTDT